MSLEFGWGADNSSGAITHSGGRIMTCCVSNLGHLVTACLDASRRRRDGVRLNRYQDVNCNAL